MKYTSKIIWGTVVILTVVALYLVFGRSGSTFGRNERNFAVEDTAKITRIFMADKREHSVELSRQPDGRWMVNNQFLVSKPIMDMFLQTLHRIQVKEPVPASSHNKIISLLAANAVKVEVYQDLPLFRLFG